MRAGARVAPGVAGQDLAAVLAPGVDRAEGRGGEGDEQRGVSTDGLGDAFAAGQARADELVGVGAVDLGAGGAAGGAPGLALDAQDAAGFAVGVVGVQDVAGRGVDVPDPSA
ncbi:hypothetical protein Skr01_74380 [Sphaerisporangium krabiense]|uniref:Uncharacterized protein n=1 Tax=Sphaerisporangium krabiense TaxID=763782 RepID=A0A7W8Z4D3_9ACTN|nr:hypothetical protein [Sphaerisporangium krabiense]GII67353.1 hypothetical protein Skr01_74380 [Sphaerisporangium krabiense]